MTFGVSPGDENHIFDAMSQDEGAMAELSTAGGEGTNSSKILVKGQGPITSKQHSKS